MLNKGYELHCQSVRLAVKERTVHQVSAANDSTIQTPEREDIFINTCNCTALRYHPAISIVL